MNHLLFALPCFLSADVLQKGFFQRSFHYNNMWRCTKKISKLWHGFFFIFNNIDRIEINFLLALVFLYKPAVLLHVCHIYCIWDYISDLGLLLEYCLASIPYQSEQVTLWNVKRSVTALQSRKYDYKDHICHLWVPVNIGFHYCINSVAYC